MQDKLVSVKLGILVSTTLLDKLNFYAYNLKKGGKFASRPQRRRRVR